MKLYNITLVALLMTALCGCSDDNILTNEIGSELEVSGGYKVSTFDISNETMCADEELETVTIILKSDNGEAREYAADVDVKGSLIRCHMRIPKSETIPDGEYYLSIRIPDGSKLGGRISVMFKNEMLHSTQGVTMEYTKLTGEGTAEHPYIIGSTIDFTSLISNLRRDSVSHGAGLYFKQTASFNAPTQSELYDGRGYYNYSFAGKYDGGGYAINNLYYIGNSDERKDSGIGLFAELHDGAEIKNLVVNDINIQNTAGDCGALAGRAFGDIKITNVKVKGNIFQGGSRCGGLIGSLTGSLSLDKYDLNLSITGADNVGGIIGMTYDTSKVKIHSVTTNEHRFTISGANNVGGLIGRIDGEFHIARVELEHTVSGEDSDLKIISATGSNQGGVIGYAQRISTESSLDSILIECPVGGSANCVGGLIGQLSCYSNVNVNYCRMSSVISGNETVGGLFGKAYVNSPSKICFVGADNLTRVVADGSAVNISGKRDVGGLFGNLDGNVEFKSKVLIAANIHAASDNLGGAFGSIGNSTLDVTNIVFDSNTMNVEGKGDCNGGVIGYAGWSTITGPSSNAFEFSTGSGIVVPTWSRFTPTYGGKVLGVNKTGGIVGKMYNSSLKSVGAECTVTGSGSYIGGIVGYLEFKSGSSNRVEYCIFKGTVNGSGDGTSGIAGKVLNEGVMQSCINYGNIGGNHSTSGIAGNVDYASSVPQISWCVNTGNITASGKSTGGVVGYLYGIDHYMTVEQCANYGYVKSTGGDRNRSGVGGIVGYCPGKKIRVMYCANHGTIESTHEQHGIGGIAGALGQDPSGVYAETNLEVGGCCNRGKITCSNDKANLGGILGYQEEGVENKNNHDSWLHDSVNFGEIASDQDEDNGGILGKVDHYGYVQNCVNFGKVRHGNGTVGTRKSSCVWHHDGLYYLDGTGKSWGSDGCISDKHKGEEGQYHGFNFDTTWEIKDGYPVPRNCKFQSVTYKQ